jgi:hypothetical protein
MKSALIGLASIACLQGIPKERNQVPTDHDPDLDTQIQILESPIGEMPAVRERHRAAEWLLGNADRAYPRLLEMLRNKTASLAVIELIPSFDRAESIAPLESLLHGTERTAWAAGQALARQSGPQALASLLRGLRSSESDAIVAAADGLIARRDREACGDLRAALTTSDDRGRYHVVRSAATLNCLPKSLLQDLAQNDPSEDIRSLAATFLTGNH